MLDDGFTLRANEPSLPVVTLAMSDQPSPFLACTVTSDGSRPAMFCLLVAQQTTPVPKSYAVGLDGNGAAILVSYDAASRGSLLRTVQARYPALSESVNTP